MGSANGPDEVLGDPVGSSPCPLHLRNRRSTDLLLSQPADRRYEVFRNGSGKKGCHFMSGKPNPLYTEVFPSEDFAAAGYWFWLKSPKAHGFDVKAFDPDHIYMRSTELQWEDNRTFKRFVHDLPIAARCVSEVELTERRFTPDAANRIRSLKWMPVSAARPDIQDARDIA